jgi:long-chain acyl-CoA synthetase
MNRATWGREITTEVVQGHPCRVYRDRPRSMAALLADARRWRGRTCLVAGQRRFGFEAFEAAVARVAAQLQSRGVGPGRRVVLLAYNSAEWLAAFWAVHALGGITVLCNAWWSPEEIADALRDVDPALVIADQSARRGLAAGSGMLDMQQVREWVDTDDAAAVPPLPAVGEDDLAIIMFTSGTTGRAKGVLMSQRGVVANLQNLLALTGRMPHELPPDAMGTVSLLTVPLFHLAGIQVSISTLLSGGRVALLEGRFDPAAVLALIQQEKVRVWGSVPTMVSRVLEHPELDRYDVSSLKSIPMGGAAIPASLREKVQRAFPGVKKSVGSLYGCTEAGGVLAAGSADDLQGRPACVGKPLPVVELRIARPDDQGVGEIEARTPTATLGVWGDPTPATDVEGWVRTGDLGRLEDGYLFMAGRSKDIVIRAGENIACAHVEQCLLQHPAVQEAAVLPLPHEDLGEEVAAVVRLRAGHSANEADLQRHAAAHLGKFEVPSRWWLRREPLPTNATGKIAKGDLKSGWAGS